MSTPYRHQRPEEIFQEHGIGVERVRGIDYHEDCYTLSIKGYRRKVLAKVIDDAYHSHDIDAIHYIAMSFRREVEMNEQKEKVKMILPRGDTSVYNIPMPQVPKPSPRFIPKSNKLLLLCD